MSWFVRAGCQALQAISRVDSLGSRVASRCILAGGITIGRSAERLTTDGRLKTDPVFVDAGRGSRLRRPKNADADAADAAEARRRQRRAAASRRRHNSEFEPASRPTAATAPSCRAAATSAWHWSSATQPPGKEAEIEPGGRLRRPLAARPLRPTAAVSLTALPTRAGSRSSRSIARRATATCWSTAPASTTGRAFRPTASRSSSARRRDGDFEIYVDGRRRRRRRAG